MVLDVNGWFGSATGSRRPVPADHADPDLRHEERIETAVRGQDAWRRGIDSVVVAGEAGLPASGASSPAVAMIANLTAITPTASTYLTIYPANQSGHSVSDINLSAGEVVPNLAVVAVDTSGDSHNGDVDLFNAAGKVNAVIDVEGWFQLTYASGISGTCRTPRPLRSRSGATVTYSGTTAATAARPRLPAAATHFQRTAGHVHGRAQPRPASLRRRRRW